MEEIYLAISSRLDRIERLTALSAKAVLAVDEAVTYTGFSKDHLYRLTSNREIPHYKKGKKLFFKKAELDAWMTEDSVPTMDDIRSAAATYVAINPNY